MERVAVADWRQVEHGDIKRLALLFDQIGVVNLSLGIDFEKTHVYGKNWRSNELEYLIDKGILFEPKLKADSWLDYMTEPQLAQKWHTWQSLQEQWKKTGEPVVCVPGAEIEKIANASQEFTSFQATLLSRLAAQDLREKGINAVAIWDSSRAADSENLDGEVLDIVLNNFPLVPANTPWEQLLDFRSDPDARHKRLALYRWISQIAKGERSYAEIQEELEWLLMEYEQHMQLHGLKAVKGFLQTLLSLGAGTLESLFKLKLSELVKLPFVFQERKIALLEAERNAPGRELAYLVKVHDSFTR
ncbi:MAG TPA: hypothetical protein VKZ53_28800 [Candidatus Angelobacter sp.]|nr:hypothetical protein [Candidatus Angelobacter sp.]